MYQTIIPITKDYLGKTHNRPTSKLVKPLKIVIHYTANTRVGADAKANRNYYNTTTNYASTQYICDGDSIIECMPWYEVAWAVGASSYTTFGNNLRKQIGGKSPNYCTVNIEMCVNGDDKWHDVVMNTASCVTHLLLNCCTTLDMDDIVRHFDITGKSCPKMYLKDSDWKELLDIINSMYQAGKTGKEPQFNYWTTKALEITTDGLNIRKGPASTWDSIGQYNKGNIAITYEETDGWYRTDKGWVSAGYVKVIDRKVEVPEQDEPSVDLVNITGITTANLNCRKTPATGDVVITYPKGTRISLLEDKNGWYRTDKGWVSGKFIQLDDNATRKIVYSNHQLNICDKSGAVIHIHKDLNIPIVLFYNDIISIGNTKATACNIDGIKGYIKELYTEK